MSTYIIDKVPDRFGGKQQDYVDQVNQIVEDTAKKIRIAVEEKQDLTQLFYEILDSLGKARNRIAVEHETEGSWQYGNRRDQKATFSGIVGLTSLCKPYEEYHRRLLPVIQKQLKTMKYTHEGFQQTASTISFDKCLGRRSSMDFSIITEGALKKWPNPFTRTEYPRFCKLCEVTPVNEGTFLERFSSLMLNKDAMQKLNKNSPKDYKCLKLSFLIIHIRKDFPDQLKSDWVLVTIRSEINDKLCDTSQFLTWMYRDKKTDVVDNMTDRSIICHIYQDPFLVEPILDDVAKVFEQVAKWDKKNIEDLKNQMALFRYEFDPTMVFDRGSSAVAEIFERSMYRSHEMKVTYTPQKMVNLETLTSPLKTFVDNYDSMIQLEKL